MIIVPTLLEKSPIHGFGVFSKGFIPKGTKAWEWNEKFDIKITEEEFPTLAKSVQEELEIHMYQPEEKGYYLYETTMGKYMNHSRTPNIDFSIVSEGWTTRDIQPNEELTCDYRQFSHDFSQIAYI